ncbi:zinc finger HIT domain-containing protein 3 [Notechis scutatus]|uniref:Zinc finger HIT domain-containing protein 3 n=1 Tax=Notechis scutatus TaxID=8663 RepID=A0A6J1V5H9_9SAUR|nr:zinc finger HIT domain-containing protein 3 [Notechis scutatus]
MPGTSAEGRCVVCRREGRQAAKYRCPGCRERYYMHTHSHKHNVVMCDCNEPLNVFGILIEECTSRVDPATRPADSDPSCPVQREKSWRAEGSPWSVDDILTEDDEDDRVPLQKLQLLRESEELRAILSNPHLRTLLLTIDQANNKSALMRRYMQEPVFVEFADCCLRTVEPEVEENEIPE